MTVSVFLPLVIATVSVLVWLAIVFVVKYWKRFWHWALKPRGISGGSMPTAGHMHRHHEHR